MPSEVRRTSLRQSSSLAWGFYAMSCNGALSHDLSVSLESHKLIRWVCRLSGCHVYHSAVFLPTHTIKRLMDARSRIVRSTVHVINNDIQFFKTGGKNRTRTCDLQRFKMPLYQLSYLSFLCLTFSHPTACLHTSWRIVFEVSIKLTDRQVANPCLNGIAT